MKIGISSWTYSWNIGVAGYPKPAHPMTAMDLLQKAKEYQVDVLQIADNLPLEKLSFGEREELAKQAKAWGIQMEVGTKGIRPERILPFLGIAEQMGSPIVRTLLHDETGCPTLAEAEEMLRLFLPELGKRNLILAIENHDFFSVKDLRKLVETLGDEHIRICLDPVNNLAQGESTNDVFAALEEYTVNFHCKDYTIARKPSNLGFDVEGCPAGEGLLDLACCRKHFPQEDLSFVVELWTPWQGDIDATCQMEACWAEISLANLKKIKEEEPYGDI